MTPRRIPEALRARPLLADGLLAATLYAALLLIWRFGERSHVPPWALAFGIPLSAVVLLRRRFPVAVLAASVLGVIGFLIVRDAGRSPLDFYPTIAAYFLATARPRLWAWACGIAAAVALSVGHGLFGPVSWLLPGVVAPALLVLTGT
ncbi:MAG TPA: hypothetical protein VE172_13750, partial [Stackebrandtia sp.]|uniref:DUF7134 domain-containing protein n=1 Tax=Stackebrandtia sp. TaxID=2023065 RepID=UPI002D58EF13